MSKTGMTPDGKKRQVDLQWAVKNWPTPNTNPTRPNEGNVRMLREKVRSGEVTEAEAEAMLNGKSVFEAQGKLPVATETEPTFWATPRVSRGGYTRDKGNKGSERLTLEGQAKKWPTPTSRDGKNKDARNRGGGGGKASVKLFATPQARDFRTGRWTNKKRSRNLNDQIAHEQED